MYPKLWQVSGISYSNLLDDLISLTYAKHYLEAELPSSRVSYSEHLDELITLAIEK